jgi:anti-sigma factor RsiW
MKKGWISPVTDSDREGTCPFAGRLMPEAYVMGDLSGVEREEFEGHFGACSDCALAVELGSFILALATRPTTMHCPAKVSPCRGRTRRRDLGMAVRRRQKSHFLPSGTGGMPDGAVCEFVKNRIPEQYLRGDLNDVEQEAFEEHYFQCIECARWTADGSTRLDN